MEHNRNTTCEKLSNLRKAISKNLLQAQSSTLTLSVFDEVDISPILEARDHLRKVHKISISLTGFFIKFCSIALQEFPLLNSYCKDDNIIFHQFSDISVAMSTKEGLVVPVIKNVDSLNLFKIEKKLFQLNYKAFKKKLTPEDIQKGTFTITNGGVFGSLISTPILNIPQSAILGIHKYQDKPVVIGKEIAIAKMMYITLSYDYRLIDNVLSNKFMRRIKDLVENATPATLMEAYSEDSLFENSSPDYF
ncbi:MAG: 2-oxo acid dehydrogenase subunit E2 [Ginsengibacter sp.]